jgi:hypothetical protein
MTHWDGYIVQRVAFLNAAILNIPIYKLMQHLSSIVGLAIILHFIYKLPVLPTTPTTEPMRYWMAVTLITSVILALRFSFGLQLQEIGSLIVSVLFSGMIALTVVGLLYKSKTAN